MFSNYKEIKKYLDTLGMFHMKAGQDRVLKALEKLKITSLPYKAVQIVGTNGKGSTSTFLSSISAEMGMKTGLFTSPHFVSVKERIKINNEEVSDDIWLKCANKVYKAHNDLTYFEFITVLGVLIYKECACDIVFFEAGLGGKFDATTALEAQITIFTPIALDHCKILGNTIEEIARDKANAMGHWTKFAISAMQEDNASKEIEKRAKELDIPLYYAENNRNIKISLNGEHQQKNASLALSTWAKIAEFYALERNIQKEEKALENAFIAGRLQNIVKEKSPIKNTQIFLDGGHNIHGLKSVQDYFENNTIYIDSIIFSCLEDKDIMEMIEIIESIAKNKKAIKEKIELLIPTISDNPRALESAKLAQKIENNNFLEAKAYKNLDECIKYLHNKKNKEDSTLLICGSLYLLAEFYALYPQFLKK